MFVALWEFEVKPGDEERFERAYGHEGEWAALFRHGKGYKGTRLLRDAGRPWVYLTMDVWGSREEYDDFLKENRHRYDALDRATEGLAMRETSLGHLEGVLQS